MAKKPDEPQRVMESTGARFPCHQCGATLEYAPGTAALMCQYCGARNEIEALLQAEASASPDPSTDAANGGTAVTLQPGEYPCPTCGATVVLESEATHITCHECAARHDMAALVRSAGAASALSAARASRMGRTGAGAGEPGIAELDFRAALASLERHAETIERRVIKCDACGAEVDAGTEMTARDCAYCGFHLNITEKTSKAIKPAGVLPFAIDASKAQSAFRGWLKKLWFAPTKVRRYANLQMRLTGMYVPYWTYDSDTTSAYAGERGDDYFVTVGSGKNRRTVRRTRWTSASGSVFVRFDDVLVLASTALPQKQAAALEPWDLTAVKPYHDAYLAGFLSQSYQVDLPGGFEIARGIMDERIRQAICADIGGDHQRIHSVHTRYDNLTYKHILLPVWLSAYRFQNKVYRFLVNARSGEVQGERPWSAWKIAGAVIAALVVIGIIVLVASQT